MSASIAPPSVESAMQMIPEPAVQDDESFFYRCPASCCCWRSTNSYLVTVVITAKRF
jgi:hypothetical protein